MHGYGSSSYGDGFADIYDDWYAEVTDVKATVDLLVHLSDEAGTDGISRILELGVGTGRLALPAAHAGLDVVGVDASEAMLGVLAERLRAETPLSGSVTAICGDMVQDLPDGPFAVVLVAYNTLFNLLERAEQEACFRAVAERLLPSGRFVVEAFVPDEVTPAGQDVSLRSMAADRVVISVSDHRPREQRTDGHFVEFTEKDGIRLRPWALRWCGVKELDEMAEAAGLALERRTADMAGSAFDDGSQTHVSIYHCG